MAYIRNKEVKTRKEHVCWGCGQKHPSGTTMNCVVGTDGGKIGNTYWCKVCSTYWNRHMDHDDEIGIGELRANDREGWESIRKELENEGR